MAEQGFAVPVTELLLNASFDDIMATAARLLGRNMALYLDSSARNTLLLASSKLYGYNKFALANAVRTPLSPYDHRCTPATSRAALGAGNYSFTTAVVEDAVETLATKNVPRLGETYVCFVSPHQSRQLRDDPEYIEVTELAPGNFMLGEIGRLSDCVFIETTQVYARVWHRHLYPAVLRQRGSRRQRLRSRHFSPGRTPRWRNHRLWA